MRNNFRHFFIWLSYICIDFVCIYLSLYTACKMRTSTIAFDVTFFSVFFKQQNPYQFVFIFWTITTIVLLNTRALYQTKREALEGYQIGVLVRSVILSTLIVIVAIYGFRFEGFPRSILVLGTGFMVFSLTIWRIFKRMFVEHIVARGYNNFNALIIGTGDIANTLYHEIKNRPGVGIKVVGCLEENEKKESVLIGIKNFGALSNFENIVREEFINKVFITSHLDSKNLLRVLSKSKKMGVAVRVVPYGFELMQGSFCKYNIGIIPILEYCEEAPLKLLFGKRIFDTIFVLLGMVVVIPIYMIIAIMIKRDSKGPVFYKSKRYGRSGKTFYMYKFRSMRVDADAMLTNLKNKNEVDGPIFKMKEDPRVTKFGKFLRKFSLDELPQLINVLKGDMSLVGPRPLPIAQIIKQDIRQLKRLEVRPGITGLWQIRGRSDISFHRLLKWDLWYINNWSFWLDLNILFQTVPVVLKGSGAY